MRPSCTSKVPHTQNATRTRPTTMTSVRSVSTTGPVAAIRWVCTSKADNARGIERSSRSVAARPWAVGSETFW